MVGVEGVEVVGSHGLELADGADEWRARLQEFRRTVDWPVEDKGLGLSYHYRTHEDPERARAELELVAERARARRPARAIRPHGARAAAAARRAQGHGRARSAAGPGLTRALFAGDDTTDLDAFGAIEELEVGVKVAVGSDEAPPELVARADVVVAGPAGLVDLLRTL